MSTHNTPLEARVAAQNRANALAYHYSKVLRLAFAPLVGMKVMNATGELSKKARAVFESATCAREAFRIWLDPGRYALDFGISVSENCEGRSGCYYAESRVCVGELNHGVLVNIFPDLASQCRTDYNAEEVTRLREDFRAKRKAFREAESALSPFGEYDS